MKILLSVHTAEAWRRSDYCKYFKSTKDNKTSHPLECQRDLFFRKLFRLLLLFYLFINKNKKTCRFSATVLQLNPEVWRPVSLESLILYRELLLIRFHSGNQAGYLCHAECHAVGLQAYFGAQSAADRARHYNWAAYVLLQQSWLCLRASSGRGLRVRTTHTGRRGRATCRRAERKRETEDAWEQPQGRFSRETLVCFYWTRTGGNWEVVPVQLQSCGELRQEGERKRTLRMTSSFRGNERCRSGWWQTSGVIGCGEWCNTLPSRLLLMAFLEAFITC